MTQPRFSKPSSCKRFKYIIIFFGLNRHKHLQWATYRFVVAIIVRSDVLPDLGGHVERPDLVGHGGVLHDATVHEYLVAEQHARVRVPR